MALRLYPGVSVGYDWNPALKAAIQTIDTYLRDSNKALATALANSQKSGSPGTTESYVTITNEATLSGERALAVQAPVTKADAGANSTVTLGVSLAVPAFTFSTVNGPGIAGSLIRSDATIALFDSTLPKDDAATAGLGVGGFPPRADHNHKFPSTLQSLANLSTLTLTDVATDQVITGSLGRLDLKQPNGWGFRATSGVAGANSVIAVTVDPSIAGQNRGLASAFLGGATLTGQDLAAWDARYSSFAGIFTTCTFNGYDTSLLDFLPTAGSATDNKAYGLHTRGPNIRNANGGWTEVAGAFIEGPRRFISNPTVTLAGTIILEAPTISATTQAGIYIRQRTAQQVAANRYGILMDAQNSGTIRRAITASNSFESATDDFICTTAAKGLISKDAQGTPEYWRTYVDSAGATVGGAKYAVNNLGVLAITRTGVPTGTLNLQIGDVGTVAPAT